MLWIVGDMGEAIVKHALQIHDGDIDHQHSIGRESMCHWLIQRSGHEAFCFQVASNIFTQVLDLLGCHLAPSVKLNRPIRVFFLFILEDGSNMPAVHGLDAPKNMRKSQSNVSHLMRNA